MNSVLADSMARAVFHVPAMDCPEELILIRRGLSRLEGVGELYPDYLGRRLQVDYDPRVVDQRQIADSIRQMGFPVESDGDTSPRRPPRWVLPKWATLLGLVALLLAAATWLAGYTAAADLLAAVATLLAVGPVALAAWRAVRLQALDMNVLMTVAALGGLATANYFETGTALVLFGIALWLESLSMERARRAVESLVELTPKVAHRMAGESIVDVSPERLAVGDVVVAMPGERIPVDGRVRRGTSAVNQAPITGESVPVTRGPGDDVFAGTLNGAASLEIEVTRPAAESTLAHIARLVEQARSGRSRTERFVDQFARTYTPVVTLLAVVLAVSPPLLWGASWLEWIHRGLVLLVIACPCALVISTPLTIVCGLNRAARGGMLIKGGEFLETAGRIQAVAFDKTGTLTRGLPTVERLQSVGPGGDERLLRMAAGLEQHSQHPLARAIVDAASERGLAIPPADEVAALDGRGVRGVIDGTLYLVGNRHLLGDALRGAPAELLDGVDTASEVTTTAVFVGTRDRLLGRIDLGDPPRDDAAQGIARLRALGIEPIVLLTGDNRFVAEHLARRLHIDQVHAELLPRDKVDLVSRLMHDHPRLAMVGDGVNDAPALAAARLGIALGQQSSDTALETADIVIMSPHVDRVADVLELGRVTRQLLTQNISVALAIKGVVLLLAAGGQATMWMAVAADVGASLLVIANGMRLLNWRPRAAAPGA